MHLLSLVPLALGVSAAALSKRAISQELYDKLSLYEQYAAASYCPDNDGATLHSSVKCSSGNCPEVEEADTSIVLTIPTTAVTDTAGFIAVDHTNSLIALSFRGSESLRNYITDLEMTLEPVDLCSGCEGFTGMYEAWGEVEDRVIPALKAARSANPSYKIVVTGHSLGGGIAYVVAPALRQAGFVVDMAPFAAPRVGNVPWVNYVINQAPALGDNYRVTHLYDPVPSLPPLTSGFAHVSPAYFIDTLAGITPTPADIEVQPGIYLNDASGPTFTAEDEAHDFYFNNISICYPANPYGVIPFGGLMSTLNLTGK